MLQNLIRSSLLFISFFREEATTYIYYAIHFAEEDIAQLLPSYCSIFSKSKEYFVSRTHILQSGLTPLGTLTDFVTRFSEWL